MENLTLTKGVFIGFFVLVAVSGLIFTLMRFLIQEKRRCILTILYKAKKPLRETDIIERSLGALAAGYTDGTLHELRVEGFIAEFESPDDVKDGVQMRRYMITNYGRAYVEERLPAPVV